MKRHASNEFVQRAAANLAGRVFISAILGLCMGSTTLAQDDPFAIKPAGGTVDATGIAAATASTAEPGGAGAQEKIVDPLVRALREAPPATPQDLALAIQWMTRLKNWNEVGRLLQLASASQWTEEQIAHMAREGGSSLWIRLGGQTELTDQQRAQVSAILAAPAQLARDPRWIDRWIDSLASQSAADRRQARRMLHDSNFAAVEQLTKRLLDGDPKVAPINLLSAVMDFGADGLDALRAACLVSDAPRSARVLSAMAQWKGSEFDVELAAGLVSLAYSPEQQSALSETISKHRGQVPTDAAIRDYLASKFHRQLDEYQAKRGQQRLLQDFVWRPGGDGKYVARAAAPLEQRTLERLAQLAAHRVLSRAATRNDLAEGTVVLLQRAYKVAPELGPAEPRVDIPNGARPADTASGKLTPAATGAVMLVGLPTSVKSDDGLWRKALVLSQQWQMHGAALRIVEVLGQGVERADGTVEQSLDSLSELLKDSRPAMRYLAFEAIAKLDPQLDYPGAERQLQTAVEMLRLESGPRVLVVGLREAYRNAAEQQLKALGASVLATNSFREALRLLEEPQPVELIVLVDRVTEASIGSAVERLRHTRKGGALPIGVLIDSLSEQDAARLSDVPGVVTGVLSREPEQMPRFMSRLEEQLDTRMLTTAQRGRFATSAANFLGVIAADPRRYHFYPLRQSAETLAASPARWSQDLQMNLLAASGTSASQEQLMRWTATGSLDKDQRLAAAQAFKRSVQRFGVRMQRSAVARSYDLYNELGPSDKVAVEALGLVLDSIEAGAGQKDWPQEPLASP